MIKQRSPKFSTESHSLHMSKSMSTVFPFQLRTQRSPEGLPELTLALLDALSHSALVEMKFSYHGDVMITWTELASDHETAHAKAVTRLSSMLPGSRLQTVPA